jgi:predicted glycoside hydrolase/deacetylase ChbG (UPF0249 family)
VRQHRDDEKRSLAEMLGHGRDARLLIVNADDFGMCHAENAATISGLQAGAFCSATIMAPCAWFADAASFARRAPEADLGVHLTHTSEWSECRWGPVSGAAAVPSLVDALGLFYADVASVYAAATLAEVERETRAQIERALAAGIDVSHLDSHMGTLQLDARYHALYVELAAEYRLPIRMASRRMLRGMGMERIADLALRLGVLAPDHFWVGGPAHPEETESYWTEVLRGLPPGVTEIYVHAAEDTPELRALCPAWAQRVADDRFFKAPLVGKVLAEEGITLIGYRALRDLQRRLQAC